MSGSYIARPTSSPYVSKQVSALFHTCTTAIFAFGHSLYGIRHIDSRVEDMDWKRKDVPS